MSFKNTQTINLPDLAATERFAQLLAQHLTTGLLFLSGDLGAGKTTLTRYLLHALGFRGQVKSPTFTLMEPYHFGEFIVYHFDCYRIESAEALEEIGIRDYCNNNALCIIEWPENAEGLLPLPDLQIQLLLSEELRVAKVTIFNAALLPLQKALAAY